ncbi:MAG TPA: glycosyltransferase family 2 protein [Terracidiphilus sp.]|nr:glycosyltransferase family 2 protein [Terracidiphilus sp.]
MIASIDKADMPADIENSQVTASVVVFRTSPDELSALLECFRLSTYKAQLLVVDNSPSDELKSVVKTSGVAEYLWLRKNIGFGAAHNIAIRELQQRGRYHMIVNPDILFGSTVIERLVRFMDGHPDVGQTMPRVEYPDGTEQRLCKQLPTPVDLLLRRFVDKRLFSRRRDRYELRDVNLQVARVVPFLSGCFMFLRTAILQTVGGFDERFFMYMEDTDLCRRINRVAQTVFVPQVLVAHGYAMGSYHSSKLLYYHLKSGAQYFNKWGWLFDSERGRLNCAARLQSSILDVSMTPRLVRDERAHDN